jgi:hypothetical protein
MQFCERDEEATQRDPDLPSGGLMASGATANSQAAMMQSLRLFCPTSQTSLQVELDPCRTKSFNDFYFAWGCFRVF